jgi:hypothetical protein
MPGFACGGIEPSREEMWSEEYFDKIASIAESLGWIRRV